MRGKVGSGRESVKVEEEYAEEGHSKACHLGKEVALGAGEKGEESVE